MTILKEQNPQESIKPEFLQDGSHDDLGVDPDQRAAETDDLQSKFDAPSYSGKELKPAEGQGETPAATPAENAELKANNQLGGEEDPTSLYKPDDQGNKKTLKRFLNKKTGIGGGLILGTAAFGIAGFVALLPLKVINTVENLQKTFFSSGEAALSKQTDVLLGSYIKKKILPSLGDNCPNTRVSRSCISAVDTSTPVGRLYQGWKDARLENTLAEKYGLEFGKRGNTYYVKAPGLDRNDGLDITSFADGNSVDIFATPGMNRREVRAAFRTAMENETYYKRVYNRFKVGRLLERKYNIKRCVIACDTRDDFSAWKDNKKLAAKSILIERVVEPRSQALGVVLECIVSGGCDTKESDGSGTGINGERRTDFQKKLDIKLEGLRAKYGRKTVDELIQTSNKFLNKSFSRAAVETAVEQIFKKTGNEAASDAAVKVAGKAVPIVGWISTAAQIVETAKTIGPALRAYAYATNAAAMVSQYMVYRTHADEIKNGRVDAELVGSLASSLGPGIKADGSGASAEATPLYGALYGGSSTQTSVFNNIFPKSYAAPAASSESSGDDCDNGKIQAGKLICPEEDLRYDNFATATGGLFNQPGLAQLSQLAGLINGVINIVSLPITKLLSVIKIPNIEALSSLLETVVGSIAKYIIPSPFSENMSGARNFVTAAGGADIAGKAAAHNVLGGKVISNSQLQTILKTENILEVEQFQQKPMYARLFDKGSRQSLISQVAMSVPFGSKGASSSYVATLLGNPFGKLMRSFGSFASTPKLYAQTGVDLCTDGGIFGATCYGYTDDDPIFQADPEEYWKNKCDNRPTTDGLAQIKQVKDWNDAAKVPSTSLTGQAENATTSPCLLLAAAVGSAGGVFTDSVLSQEDLGTAQSETNLGSVKATIVGDNAFPLAPNKSVITNPGIFKNNTTNTAGHPYTAYDILSPPGTPVVAFLGGTVTNISQDKCPGRLVGVYNEPSNLIVSYLHLDFASSVSEGTVVKAGDLIGRVGTAANGCGVAHLHIDAAIGKTRPGCKREDCPPSSASKFVDIGPQLFKTYEAMPP